MLAYAVRRSRRLRVVQRPRLVVGDIRRLPFHDRYFSVVMAPYGMLQSLTKERDLKATLGEARRVLRKGATLGIDLVPDLPAWEEYENRVTFRGRNERTGAHVTLFESVQQDRRRRLTLFDQEYVERRGALTRRHRFGLTFRTLPLPAMVARVEAAGFRVTAVLGDYRGRSWDLRADVWLILAERT
jgi:hypothetical protein